MKITGGRVVLAIVLLAGLVGVGSALTGRLPLLTHAWGTIGSTVASSVAALPSFVAPPPSETMDTSVPVREDAGTVLRQTAPLSSAQLGAPLVRGAFVTACGAPEDMKVIAKVTVKMGRAVSVAVKTQPPNPAVASCIERATRDLQWDVSPKIDHVTVTYGAATLQ